MLAPALTDTFVVNSLDLDSAALRPESFVSFGIGQKGRLHSMFIRLRSLQTVKEESLAFGSVGFMYPGQPIGWLRFQDL